jgi:hypothetical protein
VLCGTTRAAKPVQTFDEIRHMSAKPATSEEEAIIDEVLQAMKSEFTKENTTLLKAKQNKSWFYYSIFYKYKKKRLQLCFFKEMKALGLEDRRRLLS